MEELLTLLCGLTLLPAKCRQGDKEMEFWHYREIIQYFPDVEGELLFSGFDVCYTVSLENTAFGLLRMEDGYIVIGPAPAIAMTDVISAEALRYAGVPDAHRNEFEALMGSVALCDLKRFLSLLRYMAKYHLNRPEAEAKFVDYPAPNAEAEKTVIARTPPVSFDVFSLKANEFGARVTAALQMGQVEELEQIIGGMGKLFSESHAHFSSQAQMHDTFVMALASACSAAATGGMSLADQDTMKNHYLELLHKIDSYRDIVRLMKSMLIDFATRVHRLQRIQVGDSLVRRICRMIENNLHERVAPTLIAKELGKDTAYICNRFKKACGITITEYIQRQKIREAQYALMVTDKPITEVAMQFGFSTANYFCTVFRKFAGCTPSDYRGRKHI